MKNIVYSNHAIQRKLERDITDTEISQTLDEPDYRLTTAEGRSIAVKKIGMKIIRVVYKEEKANIVVITVY